MAGRREKGQSNVWPSMSGGEDEDRTHDLRIANAALSQLSYVPTLSVYSSSKSWSLESAGPESRPVAGL